MRPPSRASALPLALAILASACAGQRPPAPAATEAPGEHVLEGLASWYGPGFHGKRTASGESYDSRDLTCAHRTLAFGTRVLVRNLENGRTCWVRVNDRGPFVHGRVVDLSYSAATALDIVGPGTARVRLELADRTAAGGDSPMSPASVAGPPAASEAGRDDGAWPDTREVVLDGSAAGGAWSVQIGAFAHAENAGRLARELQRRGVDARVDVDGTLARVRVGPYDSEDRAALAAHQLRHDGFEAVLVQLAP